MRRLSLLLRNSLIVSVLLALLTPTGGLAQAAAKAEGKAEIQKTAKLDPDFTYSSRDRRDPFEALHLAKIRASRAGSNPKEGYELEELRLVGILKTNNGRLALMEDMQGKGLTFKKGDFLNKNTWVVDVEEERVTVAYRVKGDIRKVAIEIPRR